MCFQKHYRDHLRTVKTNSLNKGMNKLVKGKCILMEEIKVLQYDQGGGDRGMQSARSGVVRMRTATQGGNMFE